MEIFLKVGRDFSRVVDVSKPTKILILHCVVQQPLDDIRRCVFEASGTASSTHVDANDDFR